MQEYEQKRSPTDREVLTHTAVNCSSSKVARHYQPSKTFVSFNVLEALVYLRVPGIHLGKYL